MSTELIEGVVKVEANPEPPHACRICLAWDVKLHDIHELGLGNMYTEITGTDLSAWDGLPQHLCLWCRAQLTRAHALRARSRRADALLKQARAHYHFITDSFIRTIDRYSSQLTNTLDYEKSENSALFYCVHDDTHEDSDIKFECHIESNAQEKDTENHSTDNQKSIDFDVDYVPKPSTDVDSDNSDIFNDNDTSVAESNLDADGVATKSDTNLETNEEKSRKRPAKQTTELKDKSEDKAKTEEDIATNKGVRKRKPQKFKEKFCTEEEIKEYEKKYNVELRFLTEEEMVQDMEDRKKSDSYLKAEYKCELCFKGFQTATSYNNHLKSHAEARGEHECHLCHWRYRSPCNLRDHARYTHRIRFMCRLCGKAERGPERIKLHAAFHAGTVFKCNYCDKHFQRKTSCWTHMRTSHQLENFESSCELCGEIFASKKGLKMHKTRSHREKVDKDLLCRKCRLQFDSKEALQHHKDLQPGGQCHNNRSACVQCGGVYPGEAELIQHKHDAHGIPLFTCDVCNKSFLSKSSLSVHIDRLHLSKKKDRPGRYTNYAPRLTAASGSDFVCEQCGMAYKCHAYLKQHQMTRHAAVRPFRCDQCPKGFVSAALLRNHVDGAHKRLRKWRCPECPKTFLHQSSVNVHRLIHIGKRTHICTYCGKAFLQSGTLITHVKYVHLKVPPPPRKRNKKKNA